jgi:hypothetical protein
MKDARSGRRSGRIWLVAAVLVVAAGAGIAGFLYLRDGKGSQPPPVRTPPPADIEAQVHNFCSACHLFPPPDTFPRDAWSDQVERGFIAALTMPKLGQKPRSEDVIRYFEERAPTELPVPQVERATEPYPVHFRRVDHPGPPGLEEFKISNVNLVHLYDQRKLDILTCDMAAGLVMVLSPYETHPQWKVLARQADFKDKSFNPGHTEVLDLDGDGVMDILVANLGNFLPTDRRCGSVVWLRGNRDGTFTPHTLFENVGRVADVQAADFRGTGKKDLIVAAFGWNQTGEVYFLENQTTDWSQPKFAPRVLDDRHGSIHVPVADLNGDGKPDFVALFAQEHETIVAFINEGGGKFAKTTLFTGPHPAYGSSGIQLVDYNNDGKLDIIYTNGDVLDRPYLLKPYHSVQWLENKGNLQFEHHPVTPLYGVHRAVAADLTGTGKKDIVAVSLLPVEAFPQRKDLKPDATVIMRETSPGHFIRYALESTTCDHVTCAVGDVFGNGRLDIVTGTFTTDTKTRYAITVWENMGPSRK